MPETWLAQVLLMGAVTLVATLYSSVGHGGASGYLAVLALFAVSPKLAATSALLLNILVAGMTWLTFWRAGHFSWSLAWPFIVGSVPAAVVGGVLRTSDPVLYIALAGVLVAAGIVMLVPRPSEVEQAPDQRPHVGTAAGVGATLGLVSGIVGIGGGIFLSPLMVLRRWSSMQRISATSACFIVVNSLAALVGRATISELRIVAMLPLVGAAFVGGLVGAWLGAKKLTTPWLRRCLAVVLLVAAAKMLLQAAKS